MTENVTYHLDIILNSNYELNIKISLKNKILYDLPYEDPFPYDKNPNKGEFKEALYEVVVNITPFTIKVIRKSTQEAIFDSSKGIRIFKFNRKNCFR